MYRNCSKGYRFSVANISDQLLFTVVRILKVATVAPHVTLHVVQFGGVCYETVLPKPPVFHVI